MSAVCFADKSEVVVEYVRELITIMMTIYAFTVIYLYSSGLRGEAGARLISALFRDDEFAQMPQWCRTLAYHGILFAAACRLQAGLWP